MWFRRDLRLSDQPALLEAVHRGDEVIPLFVLDDVLWGRAGDARRAFLAGCLRALDESMDGRLVVRRGVPWEVVPAVAREVEASEVFVAADFGPYGSARDARVAAALAASVDGSVGGSVDGRSLVPVGSPYAVPPGSVVTKEGGAYKVFTPFARAWRAHGWPPPARAPRSPRWAGGVASDGIPPAPSVGAIRLPAPGETAAKRAARRFWDGGLAEYRSARNDPGRDGTSRLSPYLRWGCLHPRQLLSSLGDSPSEVSFRTELCWREFYADVLFQDPESARRSWSPRMRGLETDGGAAADRRFEAWAEGRTGYPLVDAGMRQLRQEAWMHNRVRMVVASFLVKDLHIDWRRGARHFMQHLVDGDLASNNHGWQWVAGTGTDASPFPRVFNPVTQSKRFDPDGTYIKRYVPELRDVDGGAVHEPWRLAGGPPPGYPAPMVDHAAERHEALRRFDALR